MTRITGRRAFLQLLADEGVTHLFGNPGTTELAIMEVVPDFPQLKFVLGLQESAVMAMADGFCRASGRLAAANVHVMPGLGNAMGALYNAKFSGSPVILTAGQQEQGHGLLEPLLYEPLGAGGAAARQVGGGSHARRRPAAHPAPRGEDRAHAAHGSGVPQPAGRRARRGSRRRHGPRSAYRHRNTTLR